MGILAAPLHRMGLGLALAGAVACASPSPSERPRPSARPAAPVPAPAPVAARAEAPRDVVHVVKKGETIYRLSRNYGVSVDAIVRANGIADVASVPIGAKLRIPGAARGGAQGTVELASIAPVGRYAASRIGESDLRFRWPVQGKLSSRYGWRRGKRHEGIDIATRPGTPVYAAESGRVIHSGWLGDYGRVVIVKHTGDYSTVYAHNRRNRVKKGAFVERGDLLAEIGSSGNASGPHLHFEIRRSRKPTNPLPYLP